MIEFTKLSIACVILNVVTCDFFHEPSAIEIKPNGVNNIDFGFSMGFQNGATPNLVVSAPTETQTGKVYSCPLTDFRNVNCNAQDIGAEKLAKTNRTLLNPDQKFYLGASIAATPDYFVTCAPLWIDLVKRRPNDAKLSVNYGTCFVNNGSTAAEIAYSTPKRQSYYDRGGMGWNALVDENIVLISKSAYLGNFLYTSRTDPSRSMITEGLRLASFFNTGFGLATGNFFNTDKMYYAFSVRETDMNGKIYFLFLNGNSLKRLDISINSEGKGSMFGYAMSAADINKDGISDLIVGAPLYREGYDRPEFGAIHIYVGGEMINKRSNLRTVVSTVEDGRFGMAIATADIDGDGIPEIIVSAPYENSGEGAVYILSGYELKRKLTQPQNKPIPLSELRMTQKLHKNGYKHFGYSLQVVKDVDENGFNELAIGSPGNGAIILYRSLHVVNASISLKLIGSDNLQLIGDPADFEVKVCIHVGYKIKTKNVPGTIIANCDVTGDVTIEDSSFVIDLSKGETEVCKYVEAKFGGNPTGTYDFTTTIRIVDEEEKLKIGDFEKSTAVFSPDSETNKSITISVYCGGAVECMPKLSLMQPHWSNGPEYTVGTTENETIMITVRNDGHSVATACVLVELQGAGVGQFSACSVIGNGKYECRLITMRRNVEKLMNITLDMKNITNANRGLDIKFSLYEVCESRKLVDEKNFTVKYLLDTGVVSVKGDNHNLDITDTEMSETDVKYFKVNQEYTIINSGNMRWVDLNALTEIGKTPFNLNATVSITEKDVCIKTHDTEKIVINCTLSLEKKSTTKVMVGVNIPKEDWAKFIADGKKQTKIESTLLLDFGTNNATASARSVSIVAYSDERSLGNNVLQIIIISIIVGLLLLAVISYVLYRKGFFKTKSKEKLLAAKETVRRKSVKRSNASHETQAPSDEGTANNDIEVEIQDNVFEELERPTLKDDNRLIRETAEVH